MNFIKLKYLGGERGRTKTSKQGGTRGETDRFMGRGSVDLRPTHRRPLLPYGLLIAKLSHFLLQLVPKFSHWLCDYFWAIQILA